MFYLNFVMGMKRTLSRKDLVHVMINFTAECALKRPAKMLVREVSLMVLLMYVILDLNARGARHYQKAKENVQKVFIAQLTVLTILPSLEEWHVMPEIAVLQRGRQVAFVANQEVITTGRNGNTALIVQKGPSAPQLTQIAIMLQG